MGQVMSRIFAHHSETDTCYTLTEDAKNCLRLSRINIMGNLI